jgi:hypothetical protein
MHRVGRESPRVEVQPPVERALVLWVRKARASEGPSPQEPCFSISRTDRTSVIEQDPCQASARETPPRRATDQDFSAVRSQDRCESPPTATDTDNVEGRVLPAVDRAVVRFGAGPDPLIRERCGGESP